MSAVDFLKQRFQVDENAVAVVAQGNEITYRQLSKAMAEMKSTLALAGISDGSVAVLKGDYSLGSISVLLALLDLNCIIIPITPASFDVLEDSIEEVTPQYLIDCTAGFPPTISKYSSSPLLPNLYQILHGRSAPGLVLFTSGSSGRPKAVVHDFSKLLEKFHVQRPAMKTLNFLLFDHWGGLNTLLHGLSNHCPLFIPEDRTPNAVCNLIERYQIELLPATPGFLNMLLISKAHQRFNLSSLRLITYGAEPMSEMTLKALYKDFPGVDIRQTYGMIELGVLRTKSKSPDSLWVKLGGEGYEIRIVDSKLEIKAASAMLGYLNAESPFTEDGYLRTGDLVEQEGEWIRILGRQSDLINVGGQKVYPAEVESVILGCPGVQDVTVYGESNPILGKIVCATVVIAEGLEQIPFRNVLKKHCSSLLQPFMVPMKIKFIDEIPLSTRFKRIRK
jgi:acyl-CoA synthetase (AMP-forming)/AMP-acid ligase II